MSKNATRPIIILGVLLASIATNLFQCTKSCGGDNITTLPDSLYNAEAERRATIAFETWRNSFLTDSISKYSTVTEKVVNRVVIQYDSLQVPFFVTEYVDRLDTIRLTDWKEREVPIKEYKLTTTNEAGCTANIAVKTLGDLIELKPEFSCPPSDTLPITPTLPTINVTGGRKHGLMVGVGVSDISNKAQFKNAIQFNLGYQYRGVLSAWATIPKDLDRLNGVGFNVGAVIPIGKK